MKKKTKAQLAATIMILIGIAAFFSFALAEPSSITDTNQHEPPAVELALDESLSGIISIDAEAGQIYDIVISASGIASFADIEIPFIYDVDVFDLIYFCAFTRNNTMVVGPVEGTGLTITEIQPGEIRFTVDREIPYGSLWSGVVNVIRLQSKTTTQTTVSVSEPIPVYLQAVTEEAAYVESDSAVLSGSFRNNFDTIDYGFYWWQYGNPSTKVILGTTDSASLDFTLELKELLPETTYYFKAFAGTAEGEALSFTTSAVGAETIESVEISVTAPVTGAAPDTSASAEGGFDISYIIWSPLPAYNAFASSTVYTVSVILTAHDGFTFNGLTDAAINNSSALILSNTGSTITLSYEFPETEPPELITITSVSINVTAPISGANPSANAEGAGSFIISGITWTPNDDIFAAGIIYTADVTLTANEGYTFNELTDAAINDNAALVTENTGDTVTLSYEFPPTTELPTISPEDFELIVFLDSWQVFDQSWVTLSVNWFGESFLLEWDVIPSNSIITGEPAIAVDSPEIFYIEWDGQNFWLAPWVTHVQPNITFSVPTVAGILTMNFYVDIIMTPPRSIGDYAPTEEQDRNLDTDAMIEESVAQELSDLHQ